VQRPRLVGILSVVEQLILRHVEHKRSSEWHNNVDGIQWRELLRDVLKILPNLLELQYPGRSSVSDAFTPFISDRETADHPVRLTSDF
jgi:hypothetical protein